MRIRYVLTALAALCVTSCLAGTISGHVFVDTNDDGQWQATDQACAGVLVSDGVAIVTTGTDGAYALQCPDAAQVVFIDNPPKTWPTRGFWRHLETGAGTADFPLAAQEQNLPFYFVHGTDLHTRPDVGEQMAEYVETLNNLPVPVAFVVHTGDLVVDSAAGETPGGRLLFEVYRKQMADLQPPLLNLAGNHEHVSWYRPSFDPDAPGVGKKLYREMFGPMHYAFSYAGVRFIALDGTDYFDGGLQYSMPAGCIAWLRAYLERVPMEDRLVLLCHEPLFSLPQKAELEQILAGRKVVLSLSGHWHTTTRSSFAGAPEIIGGAVSWSWHGAIPALDAMGYHVVRINEDGFDSGFGNAREKYSVTFAQPTVYQSLAGQVSVKAQILDLAREVNGARIELGGAAQDVTELAQEGLYRVATATLDLSAAPEGFHDLRVTMNGEGGPWVEHQPRLVASGNVEEFTPTGPATLTAVLRKVDAENAIKVNGEQIGTTPTDPAAGAAFKMEVPARLLRRLNRIEFESALLADGKTYDDFTAERVTLQYGDAKYRDPRTFSGAQATLNGKQPTTGPLWIDLTYPVR